MTVWVFQHVCSSHVLNRANKRGHSEAIAADTVFPGWKCLVISRVISIASEDSRAAVRVAREGRGGEGRGDRVGEASSDREWMRLVNSARGAERRPGSSTLPRPRPCAAHLHLQ